MHPTIFTPSAPFPVRGKTYSFITFRRAAGVADLATHRRYNHPRSAMCAVLGQLAGVPGSVIAKLPDNDFVRLEAETRHLFAVA